MGTQLDTVAGKIKVELSYSYQSLSILVRHVKDLVGGPRGSEAPHSMPPACYHSPGNGARTMELQSQSYPPPPPPPPPPMQVPREGVESADPYVKLYLLPDAEKITKKKTKVARRTLHPTYNEIVRSLICISMIVPVHDTILHVGLGSRAQTPPLAGKRVW